MKPIKIIIVGDISSPEVKETQRIIQNTFDNLSAEQRHYQGNVGIELLIRQEQPIPEAFKSGRFPLGAVGNIIKELPILSPEAIDRARKDYTYWLEHFGPSAVMHTDLASHPIQFRDLNDETQRVYIAKAGCNQYSLDGGKTIKTTDLYDEEKNAYYFYRPSETITGELNTYVMSGKAGADMMKDLYGVPTEESKGFITEAEMIAGLENEATTPEREAKGIDMEALAAMANSMNSEPAEPHVTDYENFKKGSPRFGKYLMHKLPEETAEDFSISLLNVTGFDTDDFMKSGNIMEYTDEQGNRTCDDEVAYQLENYTLFQDAYDQCWVLYRKD